MHGCRRGGALAPHVRQFSMRWTAHIPASTAAGSERRAAHDLTWRRAISRQRVGGRAPPDRLLPPWGEHLPSRSVTLTSAPNGCRGETVVAIGRDMNTPRNPRRCRGRGTRHSRNARGDAGVGERSRDDVLKAELRVELVLRRRPGPVCWRRLVNPDVARSIASQRGTMREGNLDCSVDGGMRASAAGILLDRNPGRMMSRGSAQASSPRAASYFPAVVDLENPCSCSNARALVRRIPPCASSAASRPSRAQRPTCSGLVIVPILALIPARAGSCNSSAVASDRRRARAAANTPRRTRIHRVWLSECQPLV